MNFINEKYTQKWCIKKMKLNDERKGQNIENPSNFKLDCPNC